LHLLSLNDFISRPDDWLTGHKGTWCATALNVNVDLESEPMARLISRILKVETILAIAAAVLLTASVVPLRKRDLPTDQTGYSDSGVQYGKASPFPASRPAAVISHRGTVREFPVALPALRTPGYYLPESIGPDYSPLN
jgi:hypothetical protein